MIVIKNRVFASFLVIVAISVIAFAESQGQEQRTPSTDENAIRQSVQSYVEAFNKGDASAVASHWSDDAEYVNAAGERLKGRKKIEAFLKKFFTDNKGLKIEASPSSIRFPFSNKAMETGKAIITRPGQTPEESLYVAEYVRKHGTWKLVNVKEEECSVGYEHLKDLDWLIGEWIDRDENATIETIYQWSRNKSFITGSFAVYVESRADLQGTQIIGWDPIGKSIKSWVFDSQGGFGQATWSRNGNQWIAESSSVLSNGDKASAINIYTFIDNNTFTFQSIGRQTGAELTPNIEEVFVVRKQPVKSSTRTNKETR
ncbi:MAG: SgcJ/EcaC family oxidoreductase [Pseudomonadota bacterium]